MSGDSRDEAAAGARPANHDEPGKGQGVGQASGTTAGEEQTDAGGAPTGGDSAGGDSTGGAWAGAAPGEEQAGAGGAWAGAAPTGGAWAGAVPGEEQAGAGGVPTAADQAEDDATGPLGLHGGEFESVWDLTVDDELRGTVDGEPRGTVDGGAGGHAAAGSGGGPVGRGGAPVDGTGGRPAPLVRGGELGLEHRAVEAVVLCAVEPVPPGLLAELLELPPARIEQVCAELAADYRSQRRGFVLAKVAGGYRYQTDPELAPFVERFAMEGVSARLSSAALETLAIIAYKQPVSRAQVAALRGVNVDGVVRLLNQRGLIAEVGHAPGPGQPVLYGTTPAFLEKLGLDSVDELPAVEDLFPGPEVVEVLEARLRPGADGP